MIIKISGKVQAAALFVADTASADPLSTPIMLQSDKPGQHLLAQPLTPKVCRNARATRVCVRACVCALNTERIRLLAHEFSTTHLLSLM